MKTAPSKAIPTESFRVLFIKPHTPTSYRMVEIPLGILYLSAHLKARLGNRVIVDLLDLRMPRNPVQALRSRLLETRPRLIGVSMQVFEQPFLREYVDVMAESAPDAHVIVGGPYATYYYDDFLENRRIRCAVIGEGETVLLHIVQRMIEGLDYFDLKGIAYHDGARIVCNPREDYIENLDALPFPDYDLISFEPYWRDHINMNMVLANRKYVHILGSRACPYRCAYCHTMFGKKLRNRTPENILDEIRMLYHRHGVREFQFVDDAFNIDRERMRRLFHGIIQSGLDIKMAFPNGLRADLLEVDDLDLMRTAGVYIVTFAVESGSPRIQRMIHKNLNIPKVMENVRHANRIGLITKGFFMLGFPGETVSEIRATVQLALDSEFDLASLFKVVPFHRTELFEMAQQVYPDIGKNAYNNFIAKRSFYEDATGVDINRIQKTAYIRFYSPRRLAGLFRKIPLKRHFMRYFLHAVREVLKT